MVSFSLGDKEDGEMDGGTALIGGVDLTQVANNTLYSYDIINQNYWSIDFQSLIYGDNNLSALTLNESKGNSTVPSSTIAITDTGSSFISLPAHLFDGLVLSMI